MLKKMLFTSIALIVTLTAAFYEAPGKPISWGCEKYCGAGWPVRTWERSCDAGPWACKVTQCAAHIEDCEYRDNFVDLCGVPAGACGF